MAEATKTEGAHPDHPTHLAHHFATSEQQYASSKLGMWVFLGTEVLLFGGLFCWYAVYRANHPEVFLYAHRYLDRTLGGLNTLVLICSSLTMAWAVRAVQIGKSKMAVRLMGITLVFAAAFLGIKFAEYHHKWKEGLLWGTHYHPVTEAVEGATGSTGAETSAATAKPPPAKPDPDRSEIAPAAAGPTGLAKPATGPLAAPKDVFLFFGIYFVMTGLHALHVIAGMVVISWLILRTRRGDFSPAYFTPVDLGGLYWHLVDIVWIFLFPLLYLIH